MRPSGASTTFPPATDGVCTGQAAPVLTEQLPGVVDPLHLAGLPGLHGPAVVTVRGWTVIVADPVWTLTDPHDLDALGHRCGWRQDRDAGLPPFVGGAVGWLSDDLSGGWLALPPDRRPAGLRARLRLGVYDSAVCVPPSRETTWIVATALPGLSTGHPAERLLRWRQRVARARDAVPRRPPAPAPRTVRLSLPPARHRAATTQALAWISRGDLYQLNLTLQTRVPWPDSGQALARRLWAASPGAAHTAWLAGRGGDPDVVSVSPETFLRVDGDRVVVRPIKGTRPRRGDPAADQAQADALLESPKDRAEHVMIVDLERNDLGRVCLPGSVTVPDLAALEAHPTVWHLTSSVVGQLRPDVGWGTLLAATFPCGSVTGAPKRMAVARTRALEPVRRGVYCGAIGVISRGLVDLSVAIRTAVVSAGVASYGTGGGIVAQSDPATEFAEAMDKAEAFLRAVNAPRPT